MKSRPISNLVAICLDFSADEARDLYAELYRLSADELVQPFPANGMIASLMRELATAGVDSA